MEAWESATLGGSTNAPSDIATIQELEDPPVPGRLYTCRNLRLCCRPATECAAQDYCLSEAIPFTWLASDDAKQPLRRLDDITGGIMVEIPW